MGASLRWRIRIRTFQPLTAPLHSLHCPAAYLMSICDQPFGSRRSGPYQNLKPTPSCWPVWLPSDSQRGVASKPEGFEPESSRLDSENAAHGGVFYSHDESNHCSFALNITRRSNGLINAPFGTNLPLSFKSVFRQSEAPFRQLRLPSCFCQRGS